MPSRQILRRPKRQSPIGDLDTRVTVHRRRQVPPVFGSVDAAFEFTGVAGDGTVWAKVQTVTGKTIFDGVAREDRAVTHSVTIRTLAGVSAESWVLLADGTRLDVVAVQNFDERGEFLELLCEAAGLSSRAAAGL